MAKPYRIGVGTRVVNRVFATMTRLGIGARYRHLLTVRGRKTGRAYSTPVDVMEVSGEEWLVAGYGVVSWVRNVRVTREAALSRGRTRRTYAVEEAAPADAVPVLRTYMKLIRVTAPHFDATPDSSDEAVAAELPRHPVFLLSLAGDAGPRRSS